MDENPYKAPAEQRANRPGMGKAIQSLIVVAVLALALLDAMIRAGIVGF